MKKGYGIILILVILLTTVVFAQKDPGAGKLMAIYC